MAGDGNGVHRSERWLKGNALRAKWLVGERASPEGVACRVNLYSGTIIISSGFAASIERGGDNTWPVMEMGCTDGKSGWRVTPFGRSG